MAEELKSFGDLLKDTLGKREASGLPPIEEANQTSEPILESNERNAILEKLQSSSLSPSISAKDEQQKTSPAADLSCVPFGKLLEMTAKHQEELRKEDTNTLDQDRDKVIKESKIDFVGKMLDMLNR